MNKDIKQLGEQANRADFALYHRVMDLDNHMSDCDCLDAVKYSFYNVMPHHEIHVYCLNCGGIAEK